MKPGNAIEVHNITKNFKVYLDKGRTLKEIALFSKRRKYEKREVLKGISFEVKKGEAIGLIGHNGCGKSTTLKLLTKIMYPDSGTIEMNGRVSSLIELGAGFHPDMSGRQNIYTNASIFGLNNKEINERLDNIIEFSELEEFIDNPVRTYSSGMYMRLAFSVAINVDADILLIDEILAVGDANFQAKCFSKLREIKANGTTIVIVSHSLGQIEQICEKSIWIHDGKIKEEGIPREVHSNYLDYMTNKAEENSQRNCEQENKDSKEKHGTVKDNKKKEFGNKRTEIVSYKILDLLTEKEKKVFKTGDSFELIIKYKRNDEKLTSSLLGFNILRDDNLCCYGTSLGIDKKRPIKLMPTGEIRIVFHNIMLLEGTYTMDISLDDGIAENYHYIYKALELQIKNMSGELGIYKVEHEWEYLDQ
jgi:ABC-2 type transport system ATP-binding protein